MNTLLYDINRLKVVYDCQEGRFSFNKINSIYQLYNIFIDHHQPLVVLYSSKDAAHFTSNNVLLL